MKNCQHVVLLDLKIYTTFSIPHSMPECNSAFSRKNLQNEEFIEEFSFLTNFS